MSEALNKVRGPKIPEPLYFKMEKVGSEWVTRQIKYLTKQDVAALLNVSERTVYDYFHRRINPLPYFEVPGGKSMLVRLDEFERWAESDRVERDEEDGL